jgi:hypothetical protein
MPRLRRPAAWALASLGVCLGSAAAPARADEPPPGEAERIDDPKLERRLGTRLVLPPDATGGALEAPVAGETPVADAASVSGPTFGRDVVVAEAKEPAKAGPLAPKVPRLQLSYRRFTFNEVNAGAGALTGPSEVFNVVSIDLFPISNTWRFGLSTQYGWQDGTFRQGGDAFIAEAFSIGGQLPGDVFTPFFEFYGGGGLMQRLHSNLNSAATAYGELGVDVGTEIFFARHAYFSVAGGYLHSVDGFVKAKVFSTISGDTLCFKLGFGI